MNQKTKEKTIKHHLSIFLKKGESISKNYNPPYKEITYYDKNNTLKKLIRDWHGLKENLEKLKVKILSTKEAESASQNITPLLEKRPGAKKFEPEWRKTELCFLLIDYLNYSEHEAKGNENKLSNYVQHKLLCLSSQKIEYTIKFQIIGIANKAISNFSTTIGNTKITSPTQRERNNLANQYNDEQWIKDVPSKKEIIDPKIPLHPFNCWGTIKKL